LLTHALHNSTPGIPRPSRQWAILHTQSPDNNEPSDTSETMFSRIAGDSERVRPSAHGDECCSKTFLTAAGLTFSSGLSAVLSMSSSATGIRSGVGMWGQPANPRQRERQRERTTPGPAPTQTTDKNGSSTGSSQPRSTAPESSAPAVSSAVPKLSLGEKARTRPLDSPRKYENK